MSKCLCRTKQRAGEGKEELQTTAWVKDVRERKEEGHVERVSDGSTFQESFGQVDGKSSSQSCPSDESPSCVCGPRLAPPRCPTIGYRDHARRHGVTGGGASMGAPSGSMGE